MMESRGKERNLRVTGIIPAFHVVGEATNHRSTTLSISRSEENAEAGAAGG